MIYVCLSLFKAGFVAENKHKQISNSVNISDFYYSKKPSILMWRKGYMNIAWNSVSGENCRFVDFLLTIAPRFHNKAGSLIIYAIITFQGAIQSPIKGLLYINRYDAPLTLA